MKYHKYFLLTALAAISLSGFSVAETQEYNEPSKKSPLPDYNFAFLGDLHFDRLHHHDTNWVQETHPGDVNQIQNYTQITNLNTQPLLEQVVASLQNQNCPTFAILQSGDFVEGLCGSYELQSVQFQEAIAFVKQVSPVPFLITKGNHDITGPGADKAYSDIIISWISEQLQALVSGTSYIVKHNNDLFVFFDSYKPDLDWLNKVLQQNPSRYIFFIIHQPVVPYNHRSAWHIFSKPQEQHQREILLSLLGKYNAIVLSGHLHFYSALLRKTENGCFIQFGLNSVIDLEEQKVELLEGIDSYGPELLKIDSGFEPKTQQTRREILTNEKPFINYFELAQTPCYSVIEVSDNAINVNIYLRSNKEIWRTLRIERSDSDVISLRPCTAKQQTN